MSLSNISLYIHAFILFLALAVIAASPLLSGSHNKPTLASQLQALSSNAAAARQKAQSSLLENSQPAHEGSNSTSRQNASLQNPKNKTSSKKGATLEIYLPCILQNGTAGLCAQKPF